MAKNPNTEERRLKKSADKFKFILDNANDLITIINENLIHEYINEKAYFDLLGYKSEDIIGKTPLTPLHPDDIKRGRKILLDGFKRGEGRSEMRIRHKKGHYLWLESRGKTFIDTDGTRKAIIISRDISERKENEQKFMGIIKNLTDIILEVDLKGIVTYVSPQCYDIMGYQPNELIGKNALKYIYSEDVPKIAEAMKKALKIEDMISVPLYRLVHKNNNILFASARGKRVSTNGNDRFIVTIRDITIQRKTEQKLKKSETMYRLISENANDLILIIGINLKVEYVNEKPLLKLTGYSLNEVMGKRVLNYIHPEDQLKNLEIFQEAFEKENQGTVESRLRHKNGHYIYVEINGRLFYDENGEPKAILIARDITERKKAEKSIMEDYKKLEELSQIKSELILQTSHEFKTPLNSIYAASQLLLRNFKEQFNDKALEFIEMIYRGSQKLKHLIENMLDASKVESGKLKLTLEKEDLVEILNNCIFDLKYWADMKNIDIDVKAPEKFILKVDQIRIEQVIVNLISNAIKYTPLNGKISISLIDKQKWVEISIKDTGIGLTKKEKEGLFQKFGKIERPSKQLDIEIEGSGLGLYISKEIVELHKGEIFAESKGRNKGSTFKIILPQVK